MDEVPPNAVLLDNNVLIGALEASKQIRSCRFAIEAAESGRYQIVLSSFVISEFLAGRLLTKSDVASFLAWIDNPFVHVYEPTREISIRAGELCRNYEKILPGDAVHLATAQLHRIPVVLTYDGTDKRSPRRRPSAMLAVDGKLPIGLQRMRIITPEQHEQDFADKEFPLGPASRA